MRLVKQWNTGVLMNTFDIPEREMKRIDEIDTKLSKLRSTYEAFLPIFHQVDRKIKGLQLEMKVLEEERVKLTQGQIMFDVPF